MGDLEQIGWRIRSIRRTANVTQEELADRSGLNANYLSEIERGIRDIRVSTLLRLARGLGVAPGDLLVDTS